MFIAMLVAYLVSILCRQLFIRDHFVLGDCSVLFYFFRVIIRMFPGGGGIEMDFTRH